ncbi:MAG TPA: hypothetical protein ENH29_02850, partial [Bacteroidetes bacterium]|nr:hypothetical protein [Bacteroidota bacterium]
MIIEKLCLASWKHIGNLELSFANGINLIHGRNEIGKSTIIDAIQKAFLGNAAGSGGEYKILKPWGTEVRAKVELVFAGKDQNRYRIEKSFPKGEANLYLNEIKITENAAKTQQELLRILGISEKTAGLFHLLFINQGETLNIFNKKENPLDEHTRSYIKNIIKETVLKEIQEFENNLKEQRNQIFTSGGKPKKNSIYAQLLAKETELKSRLEPLKERENLFAENLIKMEGYENRLLEIQTVEKKQDACLLQLHGKKKQLDIFEKKKLTFEPLKKSYEQLLRVERTIDEIGKRLPALWQMRQKSMQKLAVEITELEKEQGNIQQLVKQLRKKKRVFEQLSELKQKYFTIKNRFLQLKSLQAQMEENRKKLPELFAVNREMLQREGEKISQKIEDYKAKCSELAEQIEKLKKQAAAAEPVFSLHCKISPVKDREINFQLKTDDSDEKTYSTKSDLEFKDFRRMKLDYQSEFSLEVTGSAQDKETEDGKSGKKNAGAVMLNQSKNDYKKLIQNLTHKKMEIDENLEKLQKSAAANLGKSVIPEGLVIDESKLKKSPDYWHETLLRTLQTFKTNKKQMQSLLQERTFSSVEKEYTKIETDLKQLTGEFSETEPVQITEIKDENIDKEVRKEHALILKLQEKQSDRNNLQNIELETEFEPSAEISGVKVNQSPQAIRDEIQQLTTRLTELKNQKNQLMQEKSAEEFKQNYFSQKDELHTLLGELDQIEPQHIHSLQDLQKEIDSVTISIKNSAAQKLEIEKQKAEISCEMKEYGSFIENLQNTEYEYQTTLNELKPELTDIFATEWLLKLVDEEKEKSQREIFRPLQNRVMEAFGKLTTDRYRVQIDNELNLNIAAKSLTGEYL